jgi:translation initiation factor eIF-2B subunit delta
MIGHAHNMIGLQHPDRIERAFSRIALDRRSGASELAAKALRVFSLAHPARDASLSRYVGDVGRLGKRLTRSRPAMTPVASAVERLLGEFARGATTCQATREAHDVLQRLVRRHIGELEQVGRDVVGHFASRFGGLRHPLLISYSTRVTQAIGALRYPRVTVCESRPAFEGRRTAKLLRPVAASVTVITESQVGAAMAECDSVVLGCDAIHVDGSIVNKMGSYLLALAARDTGRPVIVLGDTYKMSRENRAARERHPIAEVWRSAPRGIALRNEAFERVPARLVDHIVLESGVFKARAVKSVWPRG